MSASAAVEFDWRDLAACVDEPAEVFFPERGDMDSVAAALSICRTCPVRGACLRAGMTEVHGIWGGATPAERRTMRRKLRAA